MRAAAAGRRNADRVRDRWCDGCPDLVQCKDRLGTPRPLEIQVEVFSCRGMLPASSGSILRSNDGLQKSTDVTKVPCLSLFVLQMPVTQPAQSANDPGQDISGMSRVRCMMTLQLRTVSTCK